MESNSSGNTQQGLEGVMRRHVLEDSGRFQNEKRQKRSKSNRITSTEPTRSLNKIIVKNDNQICSPHRKRDTNKVSRNLANNSNKSNGGMRTICNVCQREFCNKYFVRRHKEKMHGIVENNGEVDYKFQIIDDKADISHSNVTGPSTTRSTELECDKETVEQKPTVKNEPESDNNDSLLFSNSQKDNGEVCSKLDKNKTLPPSNKRVLRDISCEKSYNKFSIGGYKRKCKSIPIPEKDEKLTETNNPPISKQNKNQIENDSKYACNPLKENFHEKHNVCESKNSIKLFNEKQSLNPKLSPTSTGQTLHKSTSNFCELCKKTLCNKYVLKTHLQKMHGISMASLLQICSEIKVPIDQRNGKEIIDELIGTDNSKKEYKENENLIRDIPQSESGPTSDLKCEFTPALTNGSEEEEQISKNSQTQNDKRQIKTYFIKSGCSYEGFSDSEIEVSEEAGERLKCNRCSYMEHLFELYSQHIEDEHNYDEQLMIYLQSIRDVIQIVNNSQILAPATGESDQEAKS